MGRRSGGVRSGGTGSEATLWACETAVASKWAGGSRGSLSVAVTSGTGVGTGSAGMSYDGGEISAATPSNYAMGGTESVSVGGAGFGGIRYVWETGGAGGRM